MPEKKENTIPQRLQIIQQKLKANKGQYNAFGKYNYRSCEDVLEAVKPLLAETDTIIILTDEIVLIGDWHYVRATARLEGGGHAIAVNAYAREPEIKKGMDASQITGTASSYARKYALNGLFCIDDTKDSDATNKHGKGKDAEPAKYEKPDTKSKEATKEVTKAARAKFVEQAWFNFQTVHADEMPDGKVFDEKFFTNEWKELYKLRDKKAFAWNQEAVNKIAERIQPANCLTDIKVAPNV